MGSSAKNTQRGIEVSAGCVVMNCAAWDNGTIGINATAARKRRPHGG